MKIKSIRFEEVGGYQQQFRRPFVFNGNVNNLELLKETLVPYIDITPNLLAPVASTILSLGAATPVTIINGWENNRFAFKIVVECNRSMTVQSDVVIRGYTDTNELTRDLKLFPTAIVEERTVMASTPEGTVFIRSPAAVHEILKSECGQLARPIDVALDASRHRDMAGLGSEVTDLRWITPRVVMQSKSCDSPAGYLSALFNGILSTQDETYWHDEIADVLYAYIRPPIMMSIRPLDELCRETDFKATGSFTLKELYSLADAFEIEMGSNVSTDRDALHVPIEGLHSDVAFAIATQIGWHAHRHGVSQMECTIIREPYDVNGGAFVGEPIIYTAGNVKDFKNSVTGLLIAGLPVDLSHQVTIDIKGSPNTDVVIKVDIDGESGIYQFPLFAASLYSPQLQSDQSELHNLTEIIDFFSHAINIR